MQHADPTNKQERATEGISVDRALMSLSCMPSNDEMMNEQHRQLPDRMECSWHSSTHQWHCPIVVQPVESWMSLGCWLCWLSDHWWSRSRWSVIGNQAQQGRAALWLSCHVSRLWDCKPSPWVNFSHVATYMIPTSAAFNLPRAVLKRPNYSKFSQCLR